MISSIDLAQQINNSNDFKKVIWSNYLKYSNGLSMKEYAEGEKKLLSMGTYGVEDFHSKVIGYFEFLDRLVED